MEKNQLFSYYWYLDEDEEEYTSIRCYGVSQDNKNICITINDFTPFIYLELPTHITWTDSKAQIIGDRIDDLMGDQRPVKKILMFKKKLYYAHINSNKSHKLYPFLLLSFNNKKDIRKLNYKIKNPQHISGLGFVKLKIHESDATPILQLTSYRNIPTAGWIEFQGKKVDNENKQTRCDLEYVVKWQNLNIPQTQLKPPKIKILSFDIEVYSKNPTAMPNPEENSDVIFQISCVIWRNGEKYDKYLLTLGEPLPEIVGEDVEIRIFDNECDLINGYTEFINETNPNVIVGYNILTFDIPYMMERNINQGCYSLDKQGFHLYSHAKEKLIKWSSKAYKNQSFKFLDAEGRLYVDLLPLIQRDYRLSNYRLDTVATHFLNAKKDPLSPQDIFKCYKIGMDYQEINNEKIYSHKAQKAMSYVGKYCVRDSELVADLMNKLQVWVGLTEMATICNVPIFFLYTQGQQIKVFSQIYKYCLHNNYIVEKDGYIPKSNEHFQGAYVEEPKPGIYDNVVSLDFCSLYPSSIIAYNIDYSTLLKDDNDDDKKIPDSDCNVVEWDEHLGCKCPEDKTDRKTKPKYILCGHNKYRFVKEPKGVMPSVLINLLAMRKQTKKDILMYEKKIAEEKLTDEEIKDIKLLISVLDKRQLAYKLSSNSMYGAMGVTRGYLPFMPAAMCVTTLGRQNIQLTAKTIQERFKGNLIYADTDCVRADVPVLILHNSKIDYITVDELSDGDWKRINENKEISKPKKGYKIWSDKGFTNIVNVVRCGIKKPISRILTHIGEVVCSNEHSLLRENLECITPIELKLKDKLCVTEFPLPKDTPKIPIYHTKLTVEIIENYIIPECKYEDINAEIAFVWGLFYADGSCGTYINKSNKYGKSSWAINKSDIKLLERCLLILNKYEDNFIFKIIDTMKSSKVYKLIVTKKYNDNNTTSIKSLVNKYRELFYDKRKYKKIPTIIFNSPLQIRQSFFMGYYSGDGSKKQPCIRFDNKGSIGSAGLFYLMKTIGYQVSVNTRNNKSDIYTITGSTPEKKMRYIPNAVKKIININEDTEKYIYDIETENHHFSAGVGQLVVHNSNYLTFPHIKTSQELWDNAIMISKEISKMFPPPVEIAFENAVYTRWLVLTKKRYMYLSCDREGNIDMISKNGVLVPKVSKKGVLLARRDNSAYIRKVYEKVVMMIFDKEDRDNILDYVLDEINKLCYYGYNYTNFIVSKSVGDYGDLNHPILYSEDKEDKKKKKIIKAKLGDYKAPALSQDTNERLRQFALKNCSTPYEYYLHCLPAHIQLCEKMKKRGQIVETGSRLEYVITTNGGILAKQYEKLEDAVYFGNHSSILRIDTMYYLKLLTKPLDQVLNIMYDNPESNKNYKHKFIKDFVLSQYKYRLKRHKLTQYISKLSQANISFEENDPEEPELIFVD